MDGSFLYRGYMLADKDILEFQMLYKKYFGVEITKEQALDKGLRLMRLIEVVSRAVADEQKDIENPAPQS